MMQMTQEIKQMKAQNLGEATGKISTAQDREDSVASERSHEHDERMEKRFQDVDLAIPKLSEVNAEGGRNREIFRWMAKVCKTVFSVGFKLYETGVMDINKVKAYCSENVLRNLICFSQKNDLTPGEMYDLNKFLEEDLLSYLCQKYPESEEAETSAKFSSDLIERDGLEDNDYDLVYRSKVDFSYQESGNYNSQIMKFLNYIISLPNKTMPSKSSTEPKAKKDKPLNELFLADMEAIFRMVEVENNTINMQKYNPKKPIEFEWTADESSEKEKQEYQQKVRSYTSFQIGQKLSKNFKPFSEFEIETGNLTLKNSEIIRVLTKWCEELEQYYGASFLLERETPFRMKDGSQKFMQKSNTRNLATFIRN